MPCAIVQAIGMGNGAIPLATLTIRECYLHVVIPIE
jgi:hypothetical protein